MNKRIFKKITSHKYIYPTKRIQNIAYHIDKNGDTIMNYKDTHVWLFILKRIKIRNKLLHKCFETHKYLMKASSRAEWLKELHRMDYRTERLQNQINKRTYVFRDGKTTIDYVGSYELDFLKFYDLELKLDPKEIAIQLNRERKDKIEK